MKNWSIYTGSGQPHQGIQNLPSPPPWRRFAENPNKAFFDVNQPVIDKINAALLLRRPLLVTGPPGTGKSTLAHSIAHELMLGQVLTWHITSRSTLQDALYRYDAIGRIQEANLRSSQQLDITPEDIGKFIQLGPLGTALLPSQYPRVLLIDDIDNSDIDLPRDLLFIFEEGRFDIPELQRLVDSVIKTDVFMFDTTEKVAIYKGQVQCTQFPFIIITSNGERDLPPNFLRRCVRVSLPLPTQNDIDRIVSAHFESDNENKLRYQQLIAKFMQSREEGAEFATTDQLLNAVYLIRSSDIDATSVIDEMFQSDRKWDLGGM